MEPSAIQKLLSETEILRAPTRRLSTFGATTIAYTVISPCGGPPEKTRVREGTVRSEKPAIMTPEAFAERFQGFGDEAREFAQWACATYRDLLRALEYNFKNEGCSTRLVAEKPAQVAERIKTELDRAETRHGAVIRCPDAGWALALLKLTLDEAARSFPVHVRDLDRRGMFDPEGRRLELTRREIEKLFSCARSDAETRAILGRKLQEHGLFEEYEDRFLALF